MKLVIQIPCFNEEEYLGKTIRDIPRSFPGIDDVKFLVIDDGSTDRTSEVAHSSGADKIVRLKQHQGLAKAFAVGLETALKMGADIIVNTDADNQYRGKDIGKLISPIIKEEADMVVGIRPIESIEHFSLGKKKLQRLGSAVVRYISNTDVPDATSGFRAFSRHAAQKIFIYTQFSYTLETIVLAGKRNLKLAFIPIKVNDKLRDSRLFDSTFHYIKHSFATLLRLSVIYEPLKTFTYVAGSFFCIALVLFGWHFLTDHHSIETLIAALFFSFVGIITFTIGILADINAANKKIMEEVLTRLRDIETNQRDKHRPPLNLIYSDKKSQDAAL